MTDQSSPITPPPELVEQWVAQAWHESTPVQVAASDLHIATQAAQWGADQELEACCEWLEKNCGRWEIPMSLHEARRPKPPSEAEQALAALNEIEDKMLGPTVQEKLIRRALERLKELEQLND